MNKPNMMNAPHRSTDGRRPLDILVRQATPVVTGALALGVGLTATGNADAAMVIQDINATATTNSSVSFDLDGDGSNDFIVEASDDQFGPSGAIRTAFKQPGIAGSLTENFALKLGFNEQVDASLFDGTAGTDTNFSRFFFQSDGPWDAVGATGFVGLFLDRLDGRHYGWVEITRGSAIVGRAGYQDLAFAAAPTPVPLPGSLPLLASGAAGLLALRRRKRAVATASHP